MLRTYTRVIETGRNGVRLYDLAITVLHEIGPVTVQNAGGRIGGQGGCVFTCFKTMARSLYADQAYVFMIDIRIKDTHGI